MGELLRPGRVCVIFDFHDTLAVKKGKHDRYVERLTTPLEKSWLNALSPVNLPFPQSLNEALFVLGYPEEAEALLADPPTFLDGQRDIREHGKINFEAIVDRKALRGWNPEDADDYYKEHIEPFDIPLQMIDVVRYFRENGSEILVVSNIPFSQREAVEAKLKGIEDMIDGLILRPDNLPTKTPFLKKVVNRIKHVDYRNVFIDDDAVNIMDVEEHCDLLFIPKTPAQIALQPIFQQQTLAVLLAKEDQRDKRKLFLRTEKPIKEDLLEMNIFL